MVLYYFLGFDQIINASVDASFEYLLISDDGVGANMIGENSEKHDFPEIIFFECIEKYSLNKLISLSSAR